MSEEKMYIARDSDGFPFLHESKPQWCGSDDFTIGDFVSDSVTSLSPDKFPEVNPGECYEVKLTLGERIETVE